MKVLYESPLDNINSSNSSKLEIPIKSVPNMESTNLANTRLSYIGREIGKTIPTLSNINWGDIKESDPDFSGYTSGTVSGSTAESVMEVLNDSAQNNKIHKTLEYEKPTEEVYFYEIPGVDDAQFFSIQSLDDSGNNVSTEIKLIVRPIKITKEVTLVI